MKIRLGVNIDHVATLRQARGTPYPDPVFAAFLAELAGADQITCHLREDRRHIQERDLEILRKTITTSLNLEMAASPEIIEIGCGLKVDMATLVPERREERTTERGLDVLSRKDMLSKTTKTLHRAGIKVSLFIDPVEEAIQASKDVGADQVEIHTGAYAEAKGEKLGKEFERIVRAVMFAKKLGLQVAAGHGLDYQNCRAICKIEGIEELNIGHSIVCRAVIVGFERAVREMIATINEARQ
jgi:pyridoxine 5-phosphate synthase